MYRHNDFFGRWFSFHGRTDRTGDEEISPQSRFQTLSGNSQKTRAHDDKD
jgi:hypothetical protein